MKKRIITMISLLLVCVLAANSVSASSVNFTTTGSMGSNITNCSILRNGGSYSSYVNFKIDSDHRLEHLYIKNINVITTTTSVTGASISKSNEFIASYSYGFGNGVLKSASGQFKVVSANFGSFTKNMSI